MIDDNKAMIAAILWNEIMSGREITPEQRKELDDFVSKMRPCEMYEGWAEDRFDLYEE